MNFNRGEPMEDYARRRRSEDDEIEIPRRMAFFKPNAGGGANSLSINPPALSVAFADRGSGIVDTTAALSTGLTIAGTFVRATVAYTRPNTGIGWIPVASGVPRFYYSRNLALPLGYLAEGTRTNHFLNASTPVTQTSPSLGTGAYTLWMEGPGDITVSANTATITGNGTASDGSPVTFTVTGTGTVDYTVSGSPDYAQSEAGSFGSSFIDTVASSVTRNVDSLAYTFSASAPATLFAEFMMNAINTTTDQAVCQVDDGTANERYGLYRANATGAFRGFVVDGGSLVADAEVAGVLTANTAYKATVAASTNDVIACRNGIFSAQDTSASMPTVTTVRIGTVTATGIPLFGSIRRVVYYNSRLTNATLQALTA